MPRGSLWLAHLGAIGGCCEGSSPICLREGDLLLGPNDLLLGEIAGCPFYISQEQYERGPRPTFLIDVAPGESDTFSLEGPEGLHFVACPASELDAGSQAQEVDTSPSAMEDESNRS